MFAVQVDWVAGHVQSTKDSALEQLTIPFSPTSHVLTSVVGENGMGSCSNALSLMDWT